LHGLKYMLSKRRGRVAVVACLAGVVALLAGLLARGSDAPDVADKPLRTFTAPGLRIGLPCTPKKISQTVNTPNGPLTLDDYVCAGGTDGYSLSTTTTPALAGRTIDPNATATGAAANLAGTAHDVRATTYQGHQAVDFRVPDATSDSVKVTVFARAVYVGSAVYFLEYLKKGNNIPVPPAAYLDFLNSLRFD
jgi:polyisoprenoid-binding protein YceI